MDRKTGSTLDRGHIMGKGAIMYQVTIFDVDGAIVYREQFMNHQDAMIFMVDTTLSNINITTAMGRNLKTKATHWELTQRTQDGSPVPS